MLKLFINAGHAHGHTKFVSDIRLVPVQSRIVNALSTLVDSKERKSLASLKLHLPTNLALVISCSNVVLFAIYFSLLNVNCRYLCGMRICVYMYKDRLNTS